MQQEHLRGASPLWHASHCNKRKIGAGVILGISAVIGIAIFTGGEASALSPSVTITSPGNIITSGSQNVIFTSDGELGIGRYQVPIEYVVENAKNVSVYLYAGTADDSTALRVKNSQGEYDDTRDKIYALETDTAVEDFTEGRGIPAGKNGVWGYRFVHEVAGYHTEEEIQTFMSQRQLTGLKDKANREAVADHWELPSDQEDHAEYRLLMEFATAVNANLPSDSYSGIVTVAIVAEPTELSLFDLTYMQQMDHDACAIVPTPLSTATVPVDSMDKAKGLASYDGTNTATWDQYHNTTTVVPQVTLKDKRDGKSYVVRKLADGNCWMAENLQYVPAVGDKLTDELTDFTASPVKEWTVADATIYPVNTTYNSAYYKWEAATAGAGAGSNIAAGARADRSICPKNWRLPTGGAIEATAGTDGLKNGDFQRLADAYGIQDNSAGGTKLQGDPLVFPLAGLYNTAGSFYGGGQSGFYWSSTSQSDTRAYYLSFGASNVNPQHNNGRANGFSVRCVAR